jgi:hypothetical protein
MKLNTFTLLFVAILFVATILIKKNKEAPVHEFQYIIDSSRLVPDEVSMCIPDENAKFINELTSEQLDSFIEIYKKILERDHYEKVDEWVWQKGDTYNINDRTSDKTRVYHLLFVFTELKVRKIEPFASRKKKVDEDWSRVPAEISWIIPHAKKYGEIEFDDDIESFLDKADSKELEFLVGLLKYHDELYNTDISYARAYFKYQEDFQPKYKEYKQIFWLINLMYCAKDELKNRN